MPDSQCAGDEEAALLDQLHREDLQRVWEQAMPPCMLPPMREDLGIPGPEEFGPEGVGAARVAAYPVAEAAQGRPA